MDRHLAACVNILAPVTSLYVWQGKREEATETPMLIKTRSALADAAVAAVRSQHSYDNPALVVLPVEGGSADFIAWIMAQTVAAEHRNASGCMRSSRARVHALDIFRPVTCGLLRIETGSSPTAIHGARSCRPPSIPRRAVTLALGLVPKRGGTPA